MKTRHIYILIIIITLFFSCRKDKADLVSPHRDYRDSIAGTYTGTIVHSTWSTPYSTSDTSSCTISVTNDYYNPNQILINGIQAKYYLNDTLIYPISSYGGGYCTPNASQLSLYFFYGQSSMNHGDVTTYRVTRQ